MSIIKGRVDQCPDKNDFDIMLAKIENMVRQEDLRIIQLELDDCAKTSDLDNIQQITKLIRKDQSLFVRCDEYFARFNTF